MKEKIINWIKGYLNPLVYILILLLGVSLYFIIKPITTPVIINIPGKGDIIVNPKPIPLPQRPNPKPELKLVTEYDTITIENEVNERLLRDYQIVVKQRDSLKLLKLYIDAITVNRYKEIVDNQDIRIETNIKTTGTLDSISTSYYIKPSQVIVDAKIKPKFLIGATTSNDFSKGLKPSFGGDVSYQSIKNDIFTLGYNTNKEAYIQYKTVIFK